jgi:hypothetical protein
MRRFDSFSPLIITSERTSQSQRHAEEGRGVHAGLRGDRPDTFYAKTCPTLELIVRITMTKAVLAERRMGAAPPQAPLP